MPMTPTMLAAVKAEIVNDPAKRGYAGRTAQEQADLMNSPYSVAGVPAATDVSAGAVEAIIVPSGELWGIQQAANKPASGTMPLTPQDQIIALAWSFNETLKRFDTIATGTPSVLKSVQTTLGNLQAVGLLSAESVAAISALVVQPGPTTSFDARVIHVLSGIDGAPNAVSAADITAAMV